MQRPVGAWLWLHASEVDGVYRIERERWIIDPPVRDRAGGAIYAARYRRDVAVIALDGKAFLCNQQSAYVQTAVFDLTVTAVGAEVSIDETGYRVVPGPCETGFRHPGSYRGTFDDDARTLTLTWDGGSQTLTRQPAGSLIAADLALPALPDEPAARIAGAWHWWVRGHDREGHVRDEDETWELAVSADGEIGGTYVREVVVWGEGGAVIPCAGRSWYRFVDRFTVRGSIADGMFYLEDAAVDPGDHPCLAATPKRRLDTATGTIDGDHLILIWRGERRQVLHRR